MNRRRTHSIIGTAREKEEKPEEMGKEGEESEAEWSELTRECLINILSRLSLEDRWRGAMLVCKSWFSAFKEEPSLHTVFNLDPYFDSPTESPRWWSPDFETKIDSMLQYVVQWTHVFLTQIRLRHCSDRSLALVAQRSKLSHKFQYPISLSSMHDCAFGIGSVL